MITFTPHASSSSGNLYTVDDGRSKLMLECGLRWKALQEALEFNVTGFAGCLVTHAHQDHAKSAKKVMESGVDLYLTQGTADALGLSGHRLKIIKPLEQFTVGTWTVIAFETAHDTEGSVGYLLANEEGEKMLFCTDSFYLASTFRGLNVIAIECNYSLDILRENVESGAVDPALKNRVMRSHLSLETLVETLKANDLSQVQAIYLLHLSSQNSNEKLFKQTIQEQTGKPVYVCGGG